MILGSFFFEFFGGQGCLVFKGKKSSIHNNYFVNRQMVTNHYSIMAMGDSSSIFSNRIEPKWDPALKYTGTATLTYSTM